MKMGFLFWSFVAMSLCMVASGFPSGTYQVAGHFDPIFQYGQRPRLSLAPRTAYTRNQRIPPMPAYLVAGSGQIKSKKRTEPAHEIKIIQQTVVVNKNPNSPPSRPSQSQSQKPISGTNQKNTPSNALSQRASGRRMGRFRSGSVHSASTGVASLPNGVHILPNLHWLRSSAVRNALRRPSSPPGSRTKMSQTQFKGSSSNGNAQAQTSLSAQQNINPTDIIIYRNGQKQPIVIRTSGHVTLSKTKAANGKSNIVISKTPSKTIANPSTTTTLKPGEDPPEPENEVAVR